MRYYWYIFGHTNWRANGNSCELYGKELSSEPSYYIRGTDGHHSKRIESYNQLRILPRISYMVTRALEEKTDSDLLKIAMFSYPDPVNIQFLKEAKKLGVKTVYRCVDDWATWNGIWYKVENELQMIELADISVASSRKMAKVFKIPYLPNACIKTYNHEVKEGKTVGFVGHADLSRFNMDLIHYLAKELPEASFELIGSDGYAGSRADNNVCIRPFVSHDVLIDYMRNFTIGIIPYRPTIGKDLSGTQPIKSWEYMACGIPQICTNGLDLPEHESVFVYCSYEDCARKIRNILSNRFDVESIRNFSATNTWRHRVNEILKLLKLYDGI